MSWLSNLVGDVTKGIEEVVPGARNLDRFLNKAGIGPADAFQNPFKPQGWAGDIEHGLSQASHSPAGRALEEAAAIAAMAYFAPELIGTMSGDFSAADMAAIDAAGAQSAAEAGTAAAAGSTGATSAAANLVAETASAGTDIPGAAATTAAAAPGGMPELVAQASRLPTMDLSGLPYLLPMVPGAMAGVPNPQARTPKLKSAADVQISDLPAAATPDLLSTFGASSTPGMGVNPALDASMGGMNITVPPGTGDIPLENAMDVQIADPTGGDPSWWQKALTGTEKYLTSPKGMLTAGMTGMSLINALRAPQLPASAKQAGALASQAANQAQTVITSGGMGTPIWGQQKAAIDASIDEQIANATAAIQQTLQNTSGQGANSAAVQAQIADVTGQLEAQRQILYQQALQQNVTNAMNELSGADQTLMNVAQLQYQESADAKQLAAQLAEMAGWLNVNWSGGTGGIKPQVPTPMPGS